MKLTLIEIENYRSIVKTEIKPNNFNVFVGQNNHGKTNLFESIEWFFSGSRKGESVEDISFRKNPNNVPTVRLTFSGAQEGANKMLHEGNQTKIRNALNGEDNITVERVANEKQRYFIINGAKVSPGTGFDSALNDFLPKLEYISARKFYDELSKFSKTTPVGLMLSGVLESILEEDEKYRQFRLKFAELFQDDTSQVKIELDKLGNNVQAYLTKQFPDTSSVKFKVTEPLFEDLLKNFETSIDDGVETTAFEKGDGMQRALMLSIIQAYADFRKERDDIGKSFLFLIDEAELHLHPTAQRSLKNALLEISDKGDQVLINTHSSVMVVDNHDSQNLYKVSKNNSISEIDFIETPTQKLSIVYDLLGGSPSDLLLPRNFLIVEGQSEFHFISVIIKRFYTDKPEIQIIFASGDQLQQQKSLDAIHKVYNPLYLRPIYKEKCVILCDLPNSQTQTNQLAQFKKDYSILTEDPVKIFVSSVSFLEAYYPQPWKKDAPIDRSQKIPLAKVVGETITQEQFETEMPVIFEALKRTWELSY